MYKDTADIKLIEEQMRRENNEKLISLVNSVEKLLKSLPSQRNDESGCVRAQDKLIEIKTPTGHVENENYKRMVKVALNDLIPNYNDALSSLLRAGYSVVQVFGSTSKDKKPPKSLTITYCPDVPKIALRELYEIFKPHGFNRIDLDRSMRPILSDVANIYIGSYVDDYSEKRKSIEVNETLEALLMDDEITGEQFNDYVCSITMEKSV
ncbi:hypothetical protein Q7I35_20285 [Aeromonas allosaccharophila]|nr:MULTISPECIES: hypothetical protein [Aeromonas]